MNGLFKRSCLKIIGMFCKSRLNFLMCSWINAHASFHIFETQNVDQVDPVWWKPKVLYICDIYSEISHFYMTGLDWSAFCIARMLLYIYIAVYHGFALKCSLQQ